MIKTVTITNHLGESMALELRFPERSGFLVREIEGLGPSKATINTTPIVTGDGSRYNSAHVASRNIVFSLTFLPNPTIEITRHNSYKYFPIKKPIIIRIETDTRICETYGYVESNEPNIFSGKQSAIISVLCPDSYFYSVDKNVTIFSGIESLFEFPFSNESLTEDLIEFGNLQLNYEKSILYSGDTSVGIIIYIHATGSVRNLVIANSRTGEIMAIDSDRLIFILGSDISSGDDIIISTIKGDKFILLRRDGVWYNIRNALSRYINWFQLERGDNLFVYNTDDGIGNLQFRIENRIAYEGI
jgi:hypothetical protein